MDTTEETCRGIRARKPTAKQFAPEEVAEKLTVSENTVHATINERNKPDSDDGPKKTMRNYDCKDVFKGVITDRTEKFSERDYEEESKHSPCTAELGELGETVEYETQFNTAEKSEKTERTEKTLEAPLTETKEEQTVDTPEEEENGMRHTFETLSSFLSSMRSDDVRLSLMNTLRNDETENTFKGSPLRRLF